MAKAARPGANSAMNIRGTIIFDYCSDASPAAAGHVKAGMTLQILDDADNVAIWRL
jgi:hypothetical protein